MIHSPQNSDGDIVHESDGWISVTRNHNNKAIVDYTLPVLCTCVNPFLPIGDAAYHQHAGGGPSHGHRQHAQKFGKDRVCGSGDILTDRQTHRQTYSSQYFATAPAGEAITFFSLRDHTYGHRLELALLGGYMSRWVVAVVTLGGGPAYPGPNAEAFCKQAQCASPGGQEIG